MQVKRMLMVGAVIALTMVGPVSAPAQSVAPTAAVRVDPARIAGLADFVDGVVAQQIATRQVAGAVVTVVYRGRVLFNRGYGFADIDRRIPVDIDRTLFHPGSISKLFTWTALMQQIAAGKVDPDADVNTYLDFRIPPFHGKPIRVRDLFQHSPGMSDVEHVITRNLSEVTPYQEWLKTRMPARLWDPGTEIAYSNWGAALAGYIVERVSGEPYVDYVQRHIFAPLGMTSSTFRDPLPPAMQARLALGYKVVNGRLVPTGPEYLGLVTPAGSMSTTGPDMARYMLAMLNGGALGSARILSPSSVRMLESDSLSNAPHLPGMAHGYLVEREAGPRLVGHAGNSIDFHSDLVLAPAEGFGFFVSETGGPGSYLARTELRNAIIGRIFPHAPTPRWSGAEQALPPMGSYRANRRDYEHPANPAHDIKVSMAGPHQLTVQIEGETTAWDQIGPHLYEQVTGARTGGPYDQLEFYGDAADPRLSFASEPYETFHYVKPGGPDPVTGGGR